MVTRAFGRLRISVNPRLASATERNPVVKNGRSGNKYSLVKVLKSQREFPYH